MSNEKDTYSVEATCQNCGERNTAYIEKGKTQDGHKEYCTKCGCVVQFKASWRYWKP